MAQSQRQWHGDHSSPMATDPQEVTVPADAPRLEGTWIYAGHWMTHFGHFFLEVLTNMWPDPADLPPITGILAHNSYRKADGGRQRERAVHRPVELATWQADLLRLAGYGDLPVHLVRGHPARVDRLMVPSRPVLLKSWALQEAVGLWQRVSDQAAARGSARRVYLSRTQWHRQANLNKRHRRSDAEWDNALDNIFAEAGFDVVHPETLSVVEQIALVRGADVLAGLSGSALHLSAFADPGTHVLEIGDVRSGDTPMPTQRMVDAARGHLTAFVAHHDDAGLRDALASRGS